MNGIYTKKMRGQIYNMLTVIWPDDRVGIAPGGFQSVSLRYWSVLLRQVQIHACFQVPQRPERARTA